MSEALKLDAAVCVNGEGHLYVDDGTGRCTYCSGGYPVEKRPSQEPWPPSPWPLASDARVPEPKLPASEVIAGSPMPSLPEDDAARKRFEAWKYLTEYFPEAFFAEVEVSIRGNEQHNPGEPLHWARGKSMKQLECAFHHMWDHKAGKTKDTDGQYHLAKAIWRLKAELQLTIEQDRARATRRTE